MPWNRCATFTGGLLRRLQKHQADGVLGYLGDRSGYEQGTRKPNAALIIPVLFTTCVAMLAGKQRF